MVFRVFSLLFVVVRGYSLFFSLLFSVVAYLFVDCWPFFFCGLLVVGCVLLFVVCCWLLVVYCLLFVVCSFFCCPLLVV